MTPPILFCLTPITWRLAFGILVLLLYLGWNIGSPGGINWLRGSRFRARRDDATRSVPRFHQREHARSLHTSFGKPWNRGPGRTRAPHPPKPYGNLPH